jgi:hypothetical protein
MGHVYLNIWRLGSVSITLRTLFPAYYDLLEYDAVYLGR